MKRANSAYSVMTVTKNCDFVELFDSKPSSSPFEWPMSLFLSCEKLGYMSGNSSSDPDDTLEMKPLGECSICGANREKQVGNQEGTVQKCAECDSRWEKAGGKLVTTFELTKCPPEPERVGEIKPKHKWKQAVADESELDKQARDASTNFVGGMVVIGIGILLSITVIGAVIGIPLILIGLGMMGAGGAQSMDAAMRQFASDFPDQAPGIDSSKSMISPQNAVVLVGYFLTYPLSIPYVWYRRRKTIE